MATFYWVGAGSSTWPDPDCWASTSGGSPGTGGGGTGLIPAPGDEVFFDSSSLAITGGPNVDVQLARLDCAGCAVDLFSAFSSGHISVGPSGYVYINTQTNLTNFNVNSGSVAFFNGVTTGLNLGTGVHSTFSTGCILSSVVFLGIDHIATFEAGSVIQNSFTLAGDLYCVCEVNAAVGATNIFIINGTVTGTGSLSADQITIDAGGICNINVTGFLNLLHGGKMVGNTLGSAFLDMNDGGAYSENAGVISGDAHMHRQCKNTGTVVGKLYADVSSNDDLEFCYFPVDIGTFGSLIVTGYPTNVQTIRI